MAIVALSIPSAMIRSSGIFGDTVMLSAFLVLPVEALNLRNAYPPPNGTRIIAGPHNKRAEVEFGSPPGTYPPTQLEEGNLDRDFAE